MAVTKTYGLTGGKVKVQVEDLLGKNPGGGWVYQAPGVGNKNAEGAHYYFKSQTAQGSHQEGGHRRPFHLQGECHRAGQYSILLRSARDTNNPGDARNDIWIKVDGNTQSVMPKGTPTLTSGGNGFVKFKGATTSWTDAHQFSTSTHGDRTRPRPWSSTRGCTPSPSRRARPAIHIELGAGGQEGRLGHRRGAAAARDRHQAPQPREAREKPAEKDREDRKAVDRRRPRSDRQDRPTRRRRQDKAADDADTGTHTDAKLGTQHADKARGRRRRRAQDRRRERRLRVEQGRRQQGPRVRP